ncbi:hypothetical protein [Rhizobium sp. BK251]|nr:hypothetical protein [Rhizobium sp. BK251]
MVSDCDVGGSPVVATGLRPARRAALVSGIAGVQVNALALSMD